MQMVSEPLPADNPVSKPLVSIASSCLLSLVIGLGRDDKMLAAISALMITSQDVAQDTIKVRRERERERERERDGEQGRRDDVSFP